MLKKLLSTALAASMLAAMAVVPAHAAKFSSANWAQYERGLYTNTSSFKECFKTYADTSSGTDQLTGVKMVASTGTALNSDKNPVAYKFGQNAADYHEHENDKASYAHMSFYLASFSDKYRKATNYLQLRIDKDGTGSSREHYYFDTWVPTGRSDNCTSVYPCNYGSSNAYTTKDWFDIVHQGRAGNGPADNVTANSHETELTASDYDKIDLIMEYNKQSGATSYLFANGKFMGSYYDSGLTDKHFHGAVIRITASSGSTRSIRNNSDYVAMKFDPDRIGHREYYNTSDYYVTFEDVMQDAGLGGEIDSTMMYRSKPGDLEWYMPGNDQTAYHYPNKLINGSTPSARVRIGENITYSGTEATIAATNTGSDYAMAARMLAGLLPINGKCGVAYENYHPRAKYIKLSFDQTISNDGMWVEYATYYSGKEQALQMWNNEGNLVVGIKGGSNVTCNGNGSKPTATMTGTNHIDWVLEPVDETDVKQYVYVNNKLAGEGSFGGQYSPRINDIIVSTKNAAGNIKIDNWDMTVCNEDATFESMGLETPSQGEETVEPIPEPEHENVKVLFTEDFEGETSASLAAKYPRTTRIGSGTCISYWGQWDNALAAGYNSDTGVYACAGAASNGSRTFEVYIPTDSSPQKGLVNAKFNIKPQASLSRQSLVLFRSDSYAADDDGKNGVLLFENGNISRYAGTWLEANIWVDLDNDTYQFNIYDTSNGKVIHQGSGTQKFNNLGGFVVKLKGSDSGKDFGEVAPIIDNIYFASAEIPDDNAFELRSFSFTDSAANLDFKVGKDAAKAVDIYAARFSGVNDQVKGLSMKSVTLNGNTKTASVTFDDQNIENGDKYRLFVWNKDTVIPALHSIDSGIKVYPNEIGDNYDVHTPLMKAFLADSIDNCSTYADGTVAAEEPLPVVFSWAGDTGCSYVLKVSENSNMSEPWTFATDETSYDVYNLKIGTRYYWTVDAVKNGETVYTTDTQTFTTVDAAPRNLLIGGSVRNARDIGGWSTTNGKRVKQGLVYRSSALDTWDNDMDRLTYCVSAGGIETMKNLLGIKTEIDFRQGHDKEVNYPAGKSTSILGSGVEYYHCPMVTGNYITDNVSSIKSIFAILADADNYPVTYHCAVGADRTGAVTYLINGLLGVSKEDLLRDYVLTNFSYQTKYRPPMSGDYVTILDNYTGSTLQEKIYNYLSQEIGVPTSDLDFIINYLTE